MTIAIWSEEDKRYGDHCVIKANGLALDLTSELETGDEIVVTIVSEREWEILTRGGSDYHTVQLVLRRIL
jgi:hypothetical protein